MTFDDVVAQNDQRILDEALKARRLKHFRDYLERTAREREMICVDCVLMHFDWIMAGRHDEEIFRS